jgi:hypothetical protein
MADFVLHVLPGVAAPNVSAGAVAFAASDGVRTSVFSPLGERFGQEGAARTAAAARMGGSDLNDLGRELK